MGPLVLVAKEVQPCKTKIEVIGALSIYIYKCGGLFSQETQAPKTAWNILVTWIIKSSDMSGKILAQFPLYSWVCHSLFGLAFTGGAMWIMENFPSTGLTSQQLLDCTNLFQSQLLSCSFLLTSGGYDSYSSFIWCGLTCWLLAPKQPWWASHQLLVGSFAI